MDRVAILLIGILTGVLLTMVMEADADEEKPVYVLVSAAPKSEPEELRAYAEAAGPLARAAGLEILARIPSVPDELVFEGSWPHTGGITIEKFESMAAFRAFWNSEAYQAAIPLREGKVDLNFVVAVPAS